MHADDLSPRVAEHVAEGVARLNDLAIGIRNVNAVACMAD